ncbi:MAG: hypothetical protein HYS24_07370 [Ignavibacteriales bacterium]|nr:hypothetical protein [Ignavibacteriales bacterium]
MTKINKNIISFFFIVLVIALNLVFTQLPLLNLLGFETSFINAIIFYFISGLYWQLYSKSICDNKINIAIKPPTFYGFVAFSPFFILIISTIFCQNCPLGDGILFYLILSMPSLFIGISVAELSNWVSNRFSHLTFIIISILFLFGFLPELYFNAQIYFYNPIFGFFPGTIYDYRIQINSELIGYRILNILLFGTIFFVLHFRKILNKKLPVIIIFFVAIIYLTSDFSKPYLKFSTDKKRIEKELKGKYTSGILEILYPNNISEKEKKILILEHLYSIKKNKNTFGLNFNQKITSIIFETGEQKKKLFGSQFADVTKPWLNQVYIDFDNYKNSLNHEILHVFSKKFGKGYFNLPKNYNPGLIEGFATAFDNNFDDYDIDYLAFLAYSNGNKISLKNLFSNLSFFVNVSSISYIYAGSFLKFLSNKYSVTKVLNFYKEPDFNKVFGIKIEEIEFDYYNYLKNLNFLFNKNKADYYFGRSPLIKQFCARAKEYDIQTAWELFDKENYSESEKLFSKVFTYSNSFSALNGMVQNEIKNKDFNSAITLLEKEETKFLKTSYYFNIEYLKAFLFGKVKKYELAAEIYDSLMIQNPSDFYFRSSFVYKTILEKDKNDFDNYLENKDSRHNIIKKYLSDNEIILQFYIESFLLNTDHGENIKYINEIEKVYSLSKSRLFSSETNYLLAKLFYKNLEFDKAVKFAEISLANSKLERKKIIKDLFDKLTWLNSNY